IEDGKINFRPESGGAKTDIPAELLATLTEGSKHNVEFARLKVASGDNAGKYYMYLNIDGETLAEGYVAANVVDANGDYTSAPSSSACSLAYMITFNFYGSNGNVISAIYDTPDQIGYHDLLIGGNPLPSRKSALNGKNIFTYERTSDSYSAVFKYRWIAGDPAKFSLSFDTDNTEGTGAESFPFCAVAKYPNQSGYGATAGANGAWEIDPSKNGALMVDMSSPLTVGGSYDIEFGRLKAIGSSASLKYYVYLKVNDTLIKSYFYTVNADGTYKSTCLSNNIVFTVYDSTGNRITADGADNILEHEGTRGDFDNNGNISFVDFATLRDVVLGIVNINDLPAGIADFDNNTDVDIFDYVSLKNYFIQPEGYTKSGSLAIGTQEHLLEDPTKTAAYIADATATLGATAYRLSMPIHNLYSATKTNGVEENVTNMNKLKEQVAELKAKGINTILYVTDSFILPYNYYNSSYCHHKTVPNPDTDTDNYIAWLTVNSLAFGALAEAVPEIKFFEPFNEINLKSIRLEKYGVNWTASESAQTNYKYTVSEKAGIMADLCWYISREVKAVDRKNQVTTPSICVGSHIGSNLEGTFLSTLYNAIESGDYPIDSAVGDKRIDNYFTIVNIHAYPEYSTGTTQQTTKVNNLASDINSTYNTMLSHGDGASRVWITETGVSSY
ncbi:MAG: cellulase family glycosylhydrolase, partial [Clostridia bacterium]|nr:cellulase family glycosylhydrolase [Clostridia bacterium]